MRQHSFKQDSASVEALRRETRQARLWGRLRQVLLVAACLFTLNLLSQWHAPQQRQAVIEAVKHYLKQLF